MNETKKWLPTRFLYKALRESGASFSSYSQLRQLEDKGKIELPRMSNSRGDRMVTQEIIEEIVKEFTPGGSGEWYYKK